MPAMTDVTIDPTYQSDSELSHDARCPPATSTWSDLTAPEPDLQEEGLIISDFTLNFETLPPVGNGMVQNTAVLPSSQMGMLAEGQGEFIPSRTDQKDESAVAGMTGLHNLGNTCFMNSGIQCLISNPHLVRFFLEEFDPHDKDAIMNTLTGQVAALLQKVWTGQFSVIRPAGFKQILGLYHPQFKDYRQHDCQEFLALLLDSLHEQLNTGSPLAKTYESAEETSQSDQEEMAPKPEIDQSDSRTDIPKLLVHQTCTITKRQAEVSPPHESNSTILNQSLSQSTLISEDSSQSDLGSLTGAVSALSHRNDPIPDTIKPFESPKLEPEFTAVDENGASLVNNSNIKHELLATSPSHLNPESSSSSSHMCSEPNNSPVKGIKVNNLKTTIEEGPISEQKGTEMQEVMEVDADNKSTSEEENKLLSLEDLYMKDTKTLNTNVANDMEGEVAMAVDSEKFHKEDNTNSPLTENTNSAQFDFEHLNDLLNLDTTKGDGPGKPFKEVNLLVNNMKEKYSDDCCSKKFLFSEKMEDENYGINNIKRIKVDEEEKNLRMQAKLKVNTDKNMTKPVNIDTTTSISNISMCSPNNEVSQGAILEDVAHSLLLPHVQGGGAATGRRTPSAHYIHMADKAWRKHITQHKSVVVDTFQGQFKSTVVCSECYHVSLTFEPFMYLSVPLPHAMERQLSVIFVPCDNKQPIQYLLTLHKQDKLKQLRVQLHSLIGEESCDIIVAEVLDNHISRILEDTTMLRFVNDTNRTIYAFEMMPAPEIPEDIQVDSDLFPESNNTSTTSGNKLTGSLDMAPNNMVTSTSNTTLGDFCDVDLSADTDNKGCDISSTTENLETDEQNKLNNSTENAAVQSWSSENEYRLIDFQHNPLSMPDSTTGFDMENEPTDWLAENEAESSNLDRDKDAHGGGATVDDISQSEKTIEEEGDNGLTQADQWKTCAICLEEMIDSDLMVHGACGGTLCHTCLEMTFKHYGEVGLMCPVCSTPVDPAIDFIPLNTMADYKPKTRILSVPVVHRLDTIDESGKVEMKLFGHPNIMYLPSNMNGDFLYASVDRVVQCLANYTIILTDGQGYHCSRCLFTQHCSGCELPREGEVSLQPGDYLGIKFSELTQAQIDATHTFHKHVSMEKLRSKEPLSLYDCFEAFTQSEVLDEHNPWFCPRCHKNQCANKTMTVWKYPNTLVVYLKRFVFHELSSTKIDNKVMFPLEGLDLSRYISGPQNDQLVYDLQSCICHFGGVNAGHYTSYAKHPVSGVWMHYNDETSTPRHPQEDDYSSGYILFYQRKGTDVDLSIPDKMNLVLDLTSSCDNNSESTTTATNPPTSPIQASEISGSASFYDTTQGNQAKSHAEPDSTNTNYDFYS